MVRASRLSFTNIVMCHFVLIDVDDSENWNRIVMSFHEYDVYFLNDYVKAYKIHGDGDPTLLYYESENLRAINVFMKRDISQFRPFMEILKPGLFYDIITPYGYGGFIFEGDTSEYSLNKFYGRYVDFIKKENIVSEFRRFHPQLLNADIMRKVSMVKDLGETVSMNLDSEDLIWNNLAKRNRNRIRKAIESGVEIQHGKGTELLDKFMKMYNRTMDIDRAEKYYYFEKDFYESINKDLRNNYEIFYAELDERIIAMSIILYANGRMHCHLHASVLEYRQIAPSNLMILEAACWGCNNGFKTLHLGGGLGSRDDNLLRFKKSFNRNSMNVFSVGSEIFNKNLYESLVEIRKKIDPDFNYTSPFFPLYRAL